MQPFIQNHQPSALPPQKLSWVTVPIIINMVLNVLALLSLPFLGALFNMAFGASSTDPTVKPEDLQILKFLSGGTLWILGFLTIFWSWLHWFSYQNLKQGKALGRNIAIALAIFNLLSFPIGTILGIVMLIGAFDQEVQRYASR